MTAGEYDLIVVGGGPAGSASAAVAARAGVKVLLLEAGAHPRIHVGESLLPGAIPLLKEMGALEAVEAAGFVRKSGALYAGWGRTPEWDLWFRDTDEYDYAWFVDRSRFDELLFRRAAEAGAQVVERAVVTDFVWDSDRVVGVRYQSPDGADVREVRSSFTIDASGQAALLSRRVGLRTLIPGLQHQALWAHFEGGGWLPPPRSHQALFVALRDRWVWYFPLSETFRSIGIVLMDDRGAMSNEARRSVFDRSVQECPTLLKALGPSARRVTPIYQARDWSYTMSRVCGPGWLLAGDAAGFIDPILSTGVHLATHAGLHAARTVRSILRGEKTEAVALEEYGAHHRGLFGDLMRMARFFYQQNLHLEDYFWESKRILLTEGTEIKPRRAFMVLTSGLIKNLALNDLREVARARREDIVRREDAPDVGSHDPDRLGFVCFHMKYGNGVDPLDLYLLIEPLDPAAPSMFRTKHWDVNCLGPRLPHRNDPMKEPQVAGALGTLLETLRLLDQGPSGNLAIFWKRNRAGIVSAIHALPETFSLVRVFGE